MSFKHSIMLYNLDQNVFIVVMKTYFYEILKIFLFLCNAVITAHTAFVSLWCLQEVFLLKNAIL